MISYRDKSLCCQKFVIRFGFKMFKDRGWILWLYIHPSNWGRGKIKVRCFLPPSTNIHTMKYMWQFAFYHTTGMVVCIEISGFSSIKSLVLLFAWIHRIFILSVTWNYPVSSYSIWLQIKYYKDLLYNPCLCSAS